VIVSQENHRPVRLFSADGATFEASTVSLREIEEKRPLQLLVPPAGVPQLFDPSYDYAKAVLGVRWLRHVRSYWRHGEIIGADYQETPATFKPPEDVDYFVSRAR